MQTANQGPVWATWERSEPEVRPDSKSLLADAFGLASTLIICLAVLIANISTHYNLYRLDILTFYLPWYEHMGSRLRDFDIPGWLPYTMSGVPFAGDPQSGWGYLPAMVSFTISPSLNGYYLFLGFHMVLAAAGTYLFARVTGIRPIGAVMAAIAFCMGNFNERIACCTIHMQVAVWIPAIFLSIEMSLRATTRSSRLLWLILAGVGTGQMIAGWIGQGAYYGALAVGAFALVRFAYHHRGSWSWTGQFKQ